MQITEQRQQLSAGDGAVALQGKTADLQGRPARFGFGRGGIGQVEIQNLFTWQLQRALLDILLRLAGIGQGGGNDGQRQQGNGSTGQGIKETHGLESFWQA